MPQLKILNATTKTRGSQRNKYINYLKNEDDASCLVEMEGLLKVAIWSLLLLFRVGERQRWICLKDTEAGDMGVEDRERGLH